MSHFIKGFALAMTLPSFVIVVELLKGAFRSGIGSFDFND